MKAAVFRALRSIQIEEVPMPEPGPGEVVVRVAACAICGSDVHMWNGRHPMVRPPTILGHEFSGTVVAVGEGVAGIQVGLSAAVDGVILCGECVYCRRGLGNVCANYRVTSYRFDGAMAEYARVPARNVYPMPSGLSFEEAALIQPLAIAYRGVREKARVAASETVGIQGAGPIGLCALLHAKSLGARVIVLEPQAARLSAAAAMGADAIVDPFREDPVARIHEFTEGLGVDKVIEAVGGNQDDTVKLACRMARRGGVITVIGSSSLDGLTLPALEFKRKELSILASQSYLGAYPKCIEIAASGALPLGKMISHVVPLEETQAAIEMIDRRVPGVVKIVIKP